MLILLKMLNLQKCFMISKCFNKYKLPLRAIKIKNKEDINLKKDYYLICIP